MLLSTAHGLKDDGQKGGRRRGCTWDLFTAGAWKSRSRIVVRGCDSTEAMGSEENIAYDGLV